MLNNALYKKRLLKQIELIKKNILYYSKVYNPECKKVKILLKRLKNLESIYVKINK